MKVIAFDLHDVLFRMDYKKVASIIWQASPKLPLITTPLNPRFWVNFAKLVHKNAVGEEYVMRMAQWHKTLMPYTQTGIAIINAQKPIQPVVAILRECKSNGHKLITFSNIGQHAYENLCMQFPDIMNLFDTAVHTTADDDYIRKPMAGAFGKLITAAQADPRDILFIDNKKKNIQAAQKYEIKGIHYRSPQQLRESLKEFLLL